METARVPLQHGIGKILFEIVCARPLIYAKVKIAVEEEEGEFRMSVK